MDLAKELRNLEYYRAIELDMIDIFPKLDTRLIDAEFNFQGLTPHNQVFQVASELWLGGYESILKEQGFYDDQYQKFSGHCHQCTPALGLVLKVLGFDVSYLECFRIKEHFPETGIIEQVPPEDEPNPEMKEEFCSIGRIPYCCLEVNIDNKNYYLTGKHLKPNNDKIEALLTPVCYIPFEGVFHHQQDKTKSGIYLQPVIPKNNPNNIDFTKRIVWKKQTFKDPNPEFFATFLRMRLI